MLYMVIEHFHDIEAVNDRFAERGRLLPPGVTYHSSWGDPDGMRWFQLMEAETDEQMAHWAQLWSDIMRIEIYPVVTSREFWTKRAANGLGLDPYDDSRGG